MSTKKTDRDYIVETMEWNHQIVIDSSGKRNKMIRGVDYDLNWIELGLF